MLAVCVERVFSKGRLVLTYLHNRLETESTHTLMCLGEWSALGLVEKDNLAHTSQLPDVLEDDEELMEDWDKV